MFRDFLAKGLIVRAFALFGVLAVIAMAAPANAAGVYAPGSETTTELRLEKSTIQPGESNTAYVTVTSTSGTPQGMVTFRIAGVASERVPLVEGEAAWDIPTDELRAGKTYRLTAFYNGVEVRFKDSQDVAYLTVTTGNVAGRSGDDVAIASTGDNAGLPSVGQSASTQVAMFAGVGLVAAGLFSLALYRRRVSL